MAYIYHPMHMHIHTCYQPGGSMEAHMYNAHTLGMQYIHFTDHDTRTGPKQYPCNRFDFSKNALTYADYPGRSCGWKDIIGDPDITFEEAAMVLHSSSQGEEYTPAGCSFFSSEKRHTVSLLADVALTVGLDFEAVGDARLVLEIRLSQRPPIHDHAHLRYVLGPVSDHLPPLTAEIPLTRSEDGLYHLHLSQDVLKEEVCDIVGGVDNAFVTLTVLLETKNGGSATCKLNKFEIESKYGFNDVVIRQREVAEQIGKRYNIKPFVTTEISGAGNDKNYYSSAVPVIDYAALNYDISHVEAIAHVKKYNSIFSYNHPLEKYKRMSIQKEDIPFILQRDAAAFVAAKAWGASLMEVGFVNGRCGFSLQDHLRLWDLISLGGVFITGYGDSDSHFSSENWFEGNNFASWIAADDAEAFPVSEESFNQSMKAGRLYTGDPVHLKNPVNFTCGDLPMGAVITVADRDKNARIMTFTAQKPEKDWTVQIVIDGQVNSTKPASDLLDADGNLQLNIEVLPTHPVSFARVEMYNSDGRCIMLTNPIYLVKTAEFAGEIPQERLYASKEVQTV